MSHISGKKEGERERGGRRSIYMIVVEGGLIFTLHKNPPDYLICHMSYMYVCPMERGWEPAEVKRGKKRVVLSKANCH